ncbi:MAG: hypothetical protein AAF990_04950 [Bacteroidota bacterium]
MKICNNCNTINEVSAVKCISCNMPGQFSLHVVAAEAPKPAEAETIQCINCGSVDAGEGPRCRHCHFPLPNKASVSAMKTVPLNRKVS